MSVCIQWWVYSSLFLLREIGETSSLKGGLSTLWPPCLACPVYVCDQMVIKRYRSPGMLRVLCPPFCTNRMRWATVSEDKRPNKRLESCITLARSSLWKSGPFSLECFQEGEKGRGREWRRTKCANSGRHACLFLGVSLILTDVRKLSCWEICTFDIAKRI